MAPQHVLIVGAGLAGPALAIALARQSIRSTILERRAASQDIGGVIMFAPNAMRVMDKIVGIGPCLRTAGSMFETIDIYTEGDGSADKVGAFHIANRGTKGLTIGRPVVHDLLLEECKDGAEMIDLKFGAKLVAIDEDEEGVTATLADGSKIRGDILIGADGIGSLARKHVLGDAAPTASYSGYVSVGCILRLKDINLPPDFQLPAFLFTRAGTILAFSMDPSGETIQWTTSLKVAERDRKLWDEYRTSGEAVASVKADYAGVEVEPIRSMVDRLTDENIRLWAPYVVRDLSSWHTDRVCLLGDAAHAVPPSVGQGAAQAFEDVGLLSRLLSSPAAVQAGYPRLFAHFEKTRRPRVELIRRMAARAEGQREKTESAWKWWVKSRVIWAGLQVITRMRTEKGDKVNGYDVMSESIEVA